MSTIAVVAISIIIPIAIFTQLKSQSRQYKQTPLSLKDRFLWAIICIAPPVSAFIQKGAPKGSGFNSCNHYLTRPKGDLEKNKWSSINSSDCLDCLQKSCISIYYYASQLTHRISWYSDPKRRRL